VLNFAKAPQLGFIWIGGGTERVATYKTRQCEFVDQMAPHEKADQNFYITANLVMNLGLRARELFESSALERLASEKKVSRMVHS
jgi:hypothetical protein